MDETFGMQYPVLSFNKWKLLDIYSSTFSFLVNQIKRLS